MLSNNVSKINNQSSFNRKINKTLKKRYSTMTALDIAIRQFVREIRENEGASLQLSTMLLNPQTGFLASYQHPTVQIPIVGVDDEVIISEIEIFIVQHQPQLYKSKNWLGAWVDNGILYLDVSKHFTNIDSCVAFAQRNNQRAFFSCAKGKSVYGYEVNGQVFYSEITANNKAYTTGTFYRCYRTGNEIRRSRRPRKCRIGERSRANTMVGGRKRQQLRVPSCHRAGGTFISS